MLRAYTVGVMQSTPHGRSQIAGWLASIVSSNHSPAFLRMATAASPLRLGSPAAQLLKPYVSPVLQLNCGAPNLDRPIQLGSDPSSPATKLSSSADVMVASLASACEQ